LRYKYYDQYTEYSYCHNAVQSGYIDIMDYDYDIDLYANEGTTASFHPFCEWRIALRKDSTVTIDISRSENNYEEIYMYAITNDEEMNYYSKDFATCNSDSFKLELDNTGYIRIRVKKLDNLSNYSINISQKIGTNDDYFVIIVIFGTFAIVIIFLAG